MFSKILVALDGSAGSRRALMAGIDLARKYDARLHVLSVEERLPAYAATVGEVEEARQEQNSYFENVQGEAMELARTHGLVITGEIRAGHEADVIVRYANEEGFDLIVLGTHGHSLVRRFFLGGTTDKVTDHAPCTVMVVR